MKKLLLSALVICMAMFVSCKKNSDDNNPGSGGSTQTVVKRIAKIHYDYTYKSWYSEDYGATWNTSSSNHESYKRESWEWDGNLIKKIKYYDSDEFVSYIDEFSYNSYNLVSEIKETDYDKDDDVYSIMFSYVDKKLSKIEFYEDIQGPKYNITCDSDGRITKIKCVYMPEDWKSAGRHHFQFIKDAKKIHGEGDEMTLKWEDDNLIELTEFDAEDFETNTVRFIYDDTNNPYNGCNSLICEVLFNESLYLLSKNNCTRIKYDDGDIEKIKFNCYDNYPLEMSFDYEYQSDYSSYMWKYISTHKYSYTYME